MDSSLVTGDSDPSKQLVKVAVPEDNKDEADEGTRATIHYKHELSGDVREGQGRVMCQWTVGGFSLYRKETYDKSYQVNIIYTLSNTNSPFYSKV
jgi:hypothetical protein